jgi:hypothetical protein
MLADTKVLQAVHISRPQWRPAVDKSKRRKMQHILKIAPSTHRPASSSLGPVDRRIRAFLAGETHGEDVLGALYGHVADEPIPERLRAILKP